jgi:hypothetical protein
LIGESAEEIKSAAAAARRCRAKKGTDEIRNGEIGCLVDEIQNLIEPIEHRYMDVSAGPQRRQKTKRSGRARARDSPVPGEHKGEAYTPNAATRSRGWSAREAGQRSVAV